MKKSLFLSFILALTTSLPLAAQWVHTPTPNDTLQPVRKLANGNVLFSIYAPKARDIKLLGDAANYNNEITTRELPNGVWTFEVTNVPEGALRYYFMVDGVATADPLMEKQYQQRMFNGFDKPSDFFGYRKDIPHGTISVLKYESKTLGCTRTIHVWTPAGYEKSKKKLPVLYLIHGGGDNDASWSGVGQADNILDNLLAEGKMKEMIVVMPNGTIKTSDLAGEVPLFVEDLKNDIVPFVEKTYNVYTDAAHRAIAGLSMGGWETLETAIKYYDMYQYIWVLSSGWFKTDKSKYELEAKHLKEIAPAFNKAVKQFVMTQGDPEDIAYYNGEATRKLFEEAGIHPEWYSRPGGHTWYTWRWNLYELAQRIFK